MALNDFHKKERLKGAVLGFALPVVLMLIANYILLQDHPITTDKFGLLRVQNDYGSYLWENLTDSGKYAVFFCLSANMVIVGLLNSKRKEFFAKGIIIPTVIYAFVLICLRALS